MSLSLSAKTQSPESFVYTQLFETYLGKRAALVVFTLISYGRLDIKELSKRASISPVIVRKTLVSLIQLGCISMWEESSPRGVVTVYYNFKEDGALMLLYSGEIIAHIDSIYNNDKIVQIIQNFLSLGNLAICEYLSSFGAADVEETTQIEKHFLSLVQDKYLVPIDKTHFITLKDIWMQTYKKAYSKLPKTATVSELKRTAEAKANAKLDFFSVLDSDSETLFIKDKTTSYQKVNPNLSLCFNFKRFLKAKRTIQLTQLCSHRIGKITSIIYQHALLSTEKLSPDIMNPLFQIGLTNEELHANKDYEPKASIMFSAKDILKTLPKDINLKDSILHGLPKRKLNGDSHNGAGKRIKTEDGYRFPDLNDIEEDEPDDDEDFENIPAIVDQHLRILVSSTIPFLKKATNGLYYVPFLELLPYLKRAVNDSILSATLGPASARILRCVRDKKLVSEKLINSTALLREKEARALTSNLVKFNFLQIQEIPKSADRAASKSVFLFRINEPHCNSFLRENLCWNIGQQLEKINSLKKENSTLIAKINRDDVKGKELDYLLPSELAQLKNFNDNQLELSVKVQRLISIWEVFKFY